MVQVCPDNDPEDEAPTWARGKTAEAPATSSAHDDLPYVVELWRSGTVERVLARAIQGGEGRAPGAPHHFAEG